MHLNKKHFKSHFLTGIFTLITVFYSCQDKTEVITSGAIEENLPQDIVEENLPQNFKIISLGDSYTIGQSVCESCRFPEQLKDSLILYFDEQDSFELEIIAQTGWTTTNLISAIESYNPPLDHSLVTLLIGVNNQYQGRPFSVYESEFIELVNIAISLVGDDPSRLIVVSIPDSAYTPFGQNFPSGYISDQLDNYNQYAENYCLENNISYVYITDITREGIENPALVASDNLHPSTLAYSKFVERLLPIAIEKIQ